MPDGNRVNDAFNESYSGAKEKEERNVRAKEQNVQEHADNVRKNVNRSSPYPFDTPPMKTMPQIAEENEKANPSKAPPAHQRTTNDSGRPIENANGRGK